jgi:hypothetical protein
MTPARFSSMAKMSANVYSLTFLPKSLKNGRGFLLPKAVGIKNI